MAEPFDLKKLLTSPLSGMYWVKVIAIGFGIFVLVFVGYGLYKAYFKKPLPSTTQNASKIDNYAYTYNLRQTFGCSRMPVVVQEPVKK